MDPILIATLISLGTAVLGGVITGTSNVINKKENDKAQQAKLENDLALMDAQFKAEQEKANKQADDQDRDTTQAEGMAGLSLNQAIQGLGQEQSNNALSYTNAEEAIEANKGNTLASNAASGTRSSSVLQAAEFTAQGSKNELKAQKETDELAQALQLQSVTAQAASNIYNIQNSRDQAQYVRDYYREPDKLNNIGTGLKNVINGNAPTAGIDKGGTGYQLYQMQRKNYNTANTPDTSFKSDLASFFGGSVSGVQAGYNIGQTATKWIPSFN